jgi:hypothetical protein
LKYEVVHGGNGRSQSKLTEASSGYEESLLNIAAVAAASPPRECPMSATLVTSSFPASGVEGCVFHESIVKAWWRRRTARALFSRPSVEEVFVYRREHEAPGGEKLAQPPIAELGSLIGVVVSVNAYHEGERAVAFRIPHLPVQRNRVFVEPPMRGVRREERRYVDGRGFHRDVVRRVFRSARVSLPRVEEALHGIGTAQSGIRQ